jgi:polysaccharide biosynthesis protein PelF
MTAEVDGMRVLMICEGTYPFHFGGLATWCHALMTELDDYEFHLLAMCDTPKAQPRFELPATVASYHAVPLWGIRTARELPARPWWREARERRRATTDATIASAFVPPFREVFGQLFDRDRNDAAFADALHALYRFLQVHDFDRTLRSRPVWDAVREEAHERFPRVAARAGYSDTRISCAELTAASQWLYHWLFAFARPLPEVDVAHATMAGLCSMVAVVCQREHGSALVLSEHGIYLRESYLAEHRARGSLFGKLLKLGWARRMTEVAYTYADRVAPCCDYNHRWESRIGVARERIRTAYYGADADRFPVAPQRLRDELVVVWAGRIDPLKDVETLLKGAAVVREQRRDVKFRLYGVAPPGNEAYHARCMALYDELRLDDVVSFEGYTSSTVTAYGEADLVVLSSISEGFPFATLEAMLCGRPVVATSVGGTSEQITPECGRLVPPRDPEAFGRAVLDVLSDEAARTKMGEAARRRAVSFFGIDRFRKTHRMIYEEAVESAAEQRSVRARVVRPLVELAELAGAGAAAAGVA